MPKRKGRGRPKGSALQKKVKRIVDVELAVSDNPSNALEVVPVLVEEQDVPVLVEEQETDTNMPKKRGRGRPKRSRAQNCQESVHGNISSHINPSDTMEVVHECEESKDADVEVVVHDNPSIALEVDPVLVEEQETDTGMPKKRGRGRQKWSRAQNCQESVRRNISSHINSSDTVEVVHEGDESEDAVPKEEGRGQPRGSTAQNCQKNADGKEIYDNQSNMMEVSPGCKEEPEADVVNRSIQRGRGRPRGSLNQKNHPQNADDIRLRAMINVRGRTKGLILEMKRNQSADGKLDVLIHPTKLVAVGPGRNDFITDLSVIVRQNARFNVNKWRKVPQSTRDTIVKKVLNNWRLQDTALVRKAIVDEAGRLYRNWRNRLHDYYLMFETKEEALKHVPDEVNDSDWKFLVDYFSSPSFQIMSMKNKVNKAKQRTSHTSGRKSFHAVSYDARDPETGKEPDLQTLWQMTHVRANGEWIDKASKEVNDKVAEQINERRCQLENSQDGMETIEPEIISTAFKTVVGKKSIMQGFRAGPESSNSIEVQQLQAQLDAQRIETDNARKECNEMRTKLVKVESQLERERRKREEVEARLLNRQKEMQEISSHAQMIETENARKECNEMRAELVEIESQLERERRKREEVEARLLDRQKEMQEINSQVQTAIQSALSQYCPPTTEAETSLKHKRKIEELEAQLHEAEDVITDIRSELARYRMN